MGQKETPAHIEDGLAELDWNIRTNKQKHKRDFGVAPPQSVEVIGQIRYPSDYDRPRSL